MNKNIVLSIIIALLFAGKVFCQKDTLKALFVDVVTSNPDLIDFSHKLEKLPKGNLNNLITGSKLFKELNENIKDTALSIYIYHQRAFEVLNFKAIPEYEDLYKDYYPNRELVNKFNNIELKQYGFELIEISDGLITIPIPGFIENLLKKDVNRELQNFLSCYTKKEQLWKLYSDDEYYKYVFETQKYLELVENYIIKNDFAAEYFKNDYYYSLIYYVLKNFERANYNDYYGYQIMDTSLTSIYEEFVNMHPESKTTWFIKTIQKLNEEVDEDLKNQILFKLIQIQCIDDNCCVTEGVKYGCKEEFFNYDDFEKNVLEIIKCYKDGDCF
jgi:hypothetical protein